MERGQRRVVAAKMSFEDDHCWHEEKPPHHNELTLSDFVTKFKNGETNNFMFCDRHRDLMLKLYCASTWPISYKDDLTWESIADTPESQVSFRDCMLVMESGLISLTPLQIISATHFQQSMVLPLAVKLYNMRPINQGGEEFDLDGSVNEIFYVLKTLSDTYIFSMPKMNRVVSRKFVFEETCQSGFYYNTFTNRQLLINLATFDERICLVPNAQLNRHVPGGENESGNVCIIGDIFIKINKRNKRKRNEPAVADEVKLTQDGECANVVMGDLADYEDEVTHENEFKKRLLFDSEPQQPVKAEYDGDDEDESQPPPQTK